MSAGPEPHPLGPPSPPETAGGWDKLVPQPVSRGVPTIRRALRHRGPTQVPHRPTSPAWPPRCPGEGPPPTPSAVPMTTSGEGRPGSTVNVLHGRSPFNAWRWFIFPCLASTRLPLEPRELSVLSGPCGFSHVRKVSYLHLVMTVSDQLEGNASLSAHPFKGHGKRPCENRPADPFSALN